MLTNVSEVSEAANFPRRSGELVSELSEPPFAGHFGYLFASRSDKFSLAEDAFPAALGFAAAVSDIVAGGNSELPHHHVTNQ